MKETKKARLERDGWTVGSAASFLALTDAEKELVELRASLARERRRRRELAQQGSRKGPRRLAATMKNQGGAAAAWSSSPKGFVICVANGGYVVSLEVSKVYRLLQRVAGDPRGWVRVVDESGEDYLYPGKLFRAITLSRPIQRALETSIEAEVPPPTPPRRSRGPRVSRR